MKQNTPLQEFIKKLEAFKIELKAKWDGDPLVTRGIVIAIAEAKSLLPKEREGIEVAFKEGWQDGQKIRSMENYSSASDYFTQTYEQ